MWTNNTNNIVDILGNYLQAWLEDLEPQELYTEMEETNKKYTAEDQKESISKYFDYLTEKIINEFKNNLSQYGLEITTETKTEEKNG